MSPNRKNKREHFCLIYETTKKMLDTILYITVTILLLSLVAMIIVGIVKARETFKEVKENLDKIKFKKQLHPN